MTSPGHACTRNIKTANRMSWKLIAFVNLRAPRSSITRTALEIELRYPLWTYRFLVTEVLQSSVSISKIHPYILKRIPGVFSDFWIYIIDYNESVTFIATNFFWVIYSLLRTRLLLSNCSPQWRSERSWNPTHLHF
jgi:hypothetical protein